MSPALCADATNGINAVPNARMAPATLATFDILGSSFRVEPARGFDAPALEAGGPYVFSRRRAGHPASLRPAPVLSADEHVDCQYDFFVRDGISVILLERNRVP